MSFRPYDPEHPEPPVERASAWRILGVWLIFPLIFACNICHPLARLLLGERKHEPLSGRWHALWRTARLTCGYCGARVIRFDFDGRPLPVPNAWRAPGCSESIATPVGVFMVWKGKWRRGHWEPNAYVPEGEFSAADVARGWYDTRFMKEADRLKAAPALDPVYRKSGTPDDWCLLYLEAPRWVDPRRLDEAIAAIAETD